MANKDLITTCDCSDPCHIMQFGLFANDHGLPPDLYVSVQLNPIHPWWKRAWIALGYILGERSRYSYGHWDEGNISPESAKKLLALLGQYFHLLGGGTTATSGTSDVMPYR